ncbi:hypothetical protein BLNAU_24984 [Blattamonas nauphoetae]|uniref:Uncharacterized protein n=1 Tax=Blattamonas nauphoetae TaxID=2049346 RepID=A0ABQ9WKW4_9EUKA|nr:hypothetical protein BLNAU_24984 [Blattamonas nauphoetae]
MMLFWMRYDPNLAPLPAQNRVINKAMTSLLPHIRSLSSLTSPCHTCDTFSSLAHRPIGFDGRRVRCGDRAGGRVLAHPDYPLRVVVLLDDVEDFQLFIEVSVAGCHHLNTSLTTRSEIHAQLNGIANSVDDLRIPFTTSFGPQQDETLKLAKFIQCPLCSLIPSKAASFLILISPLIPRAAPKPSIDLKLDQLCFVQDDNTFLSLNFHFKSVVLGSTVIDADPSNISLLITDTQIKACQLSRTDISEINSSATQHSMGTLSFTFFGTLTTLFAPTRSENVSRCLLILTVLFTTRSPFLVSFSSPTQTFTCIRASEFHLRMCECRVQLDDNTNTPPRQSTANTDITKMALSFCHAAQSHPTLPLGLAAVASGAAHSLEIVHVNICDRPSAILVVHLVSPCRSLSSLRSSPTPIADTNIVREGHTTPSPSLRQTG